MLGPTRNQLARLVIRTAPGAHELVRPVLQVAGIGGRELSGGDELLRAAWSSTIDLLLIEAPTPLYDTLELCAQLRRFFQFPILVLEQGGAEHERIALLDAGADDVLSIPAGLAELPARCTMLMRRLGRQIARDPDAGYLRAGALRLDIARCRLLLPGQAGVDLTPAQTRLLGLLISAQGACVPLPAVSVHVFGAVAVNAGKRVANLLRDLEGRLAPAGAAPFVDYVKGHGYRVIAPEP